MAVTVTVNYTLEVEQYSLQNPEDHLATLAGGPKFTKFDLKQAISSCVRDAYGVHTL